MATGSQGAACPCPATGVSLAPCELHRPRGWASPPGPAEPCGLGKRGQEPGPWSALGLGCLH